MSTVIVKEDVLRDLTRYADPAITFVGARVIVVLKQELFDSQGVPMGTATVTFEGKRNFGRTVTFECPVKAKVEGAPEFERSYFEQAAQFAVEAFADIGSEDK